MHNLLMVKRKAEYIEGDKARENFKRGMQSLFSGSKETGLQIEAAAREGYRPQKVRQEQGLERLRFPRLCRRMVERIGSLAC